MKFQFFQETGNSHKVNYIDCKDSQQLYSRYVPAYVLGIFILPALNTMTWSFSVLIRKSCMQESITIKDISIARDGREFNLILISVEISGKSSEPIT